MDIYELSKLASEGQTGPYFDYLRQTRPLMRDLEYPIQIHPAACPAGCPVTVYYPCEGKLHSHPDNSWTDCSPWFVKVERRYGMHMLCEQCARSTDPLGLNDDNY